MARQTVRSRAISSHVVVSRVNRGRQHITHHRCLCVRSSAQQTAVYDVYHSLITVASLNASTYRWSMSSWLKPSSHLRCDNVTTTARLCSTYVDAACHYGEVNPIPYYMPISPLPSLFTNPPIYFPTIPPLPLPIPIHTPLFYRLLLFLSGFSFTLTPEN